MGSRSTDEWFTNVVLYQRYMHVVLWNLFLQMFLVWAVKIACLLLPNAFGIVSPPVSSVVYCHIYITILLFCLCFIFFKNVKVYPELPGAPLSIVWSLIKPYNWLQGALFALLGALWSLCLLATSVFPSYSHFWLQTPACLKESSNCCVSEHHFFVFLHGAYLGISFYFAYQIGHLYALKFESVQQLKLPTAKASLGKQLKKSFFIVLRKVRYFYLFYYLFGFIPKYVVSQTFGQRFCDDSSLTSLSGLIDLKLLTAVCVVGTLVHASWTTVLSLVQIFLTESYSFPIDVSQEKDKVMLLTNALSSQNCDLLQHLAFQYLANAAQYSSANRQKIYAISIPGGHPHTWNEISRRCLQVIDQFQSTLCEAISTTSSGSAKTAPIAHLNISSFYGQTPETKSSAVPRYPQTSTPLSPSSKPSSVTERQNLGISLKARNMVDNGMVSKASYTSETKVLFAKNDKIDLVKGFFAEPVNKSLENLMNKPVVKFLTTEPCERKLEKLMCSCQLVIWSVNALSFLVRASYKEDNNGVVQWNIAKIVSSLLELQMAMERCPKGMLRNNSSKVTLFASLKNFSLKSSLNAAINSGLYCITCTFKHHLKYIELSDDHRKRIERYLQMKE